MTYLQISVSYLYKIIAVKYKTANYLTEGIHFNKFGICKYD